MHETPCHDFSQPGAIYWWTTTTELHRFINYYSIFYNECACTHLPRTPSCDFSQPDAMVVTSSQGGDILSIVFLSMFAIDTMISIGRMEDRGEVISVKFSYDMKILAVQRSQKSVVS